MKPPIAARESFLQKLGAETADCRQRKLLTKNWRWNRRLWRILHQDWDRLEEGNGYQNLKLATSKIVGIHFGNFTDGELQFSVCESPCEILDFRKSQIWHLSFAGWEIIHCDFPGWMFRWWVLQHSQISFWSSFWVLVCHILYFCQHSHSICSADAYWKNTLKNHRTS